MIVAVYGSPRKKGNTDLLMEAFLEPLSQQESISRFYLRDMALKPCIACGGCDKTGVCVFNDDIWGIYKEIEKAKAVILSSPIYFGSMTAIMKTFIDRAQAFWARKYLLGRSNPRPGQREFFICAGAIKTDKYFLNAQLIVKTHAHNMDLEYDRGLFVPGVDGKGEVKDAENALESAREAGKNFLTTLYSQPE